MMLNYLVTCVILVSAGILVGSLFLVRQLINQIPPGGRRRKWVILAALTIIFIIGYLIYALVSWNHTFALTDLIVPGIFFLSACFIWLIFSLSSQAAFDMRRVNLLEQESIIDLVSGVYNRRYLDRRLKEEYARVERYKNTLSLLLVDIDHFKQINETYGNQAGDIVLHFVSKLILNAVRTPDVVARYDGDELLVIAPNTPASPAGALAERLRQQVESHVLLLTTEPSIRTEIHVTVSIAVTSSCAEADSIEKLIHQVNEALLRAKKGGRNRVVIHEADISKS